MCVINPRRTCAARVAVVVLSLCVSACRCLFCHYRLRGSLSAIPTAAELCEAKILKSDFAETTAFESEKLARSRTELRGPTHQLAVHMRILCAFKMRGAANLDRVLSLCVPWRHKNSQRMACIDSRMLYTTVASPCQTLCELLAGETHTDSPAHKLAVFHFMRKPAFS